MSKENTIGSLLQEMGQEESWKVDHAKAMECLNLEDTIGRGILWYKRIREIDQTYSNAVRKGVARENVEIAREIEAAYRWWLRPFPKVRLEIGSFEAEYGSVKGAQELASYYNDCPVRAFDYDGTQEAISQFNQKKGKPCTQAIDEIRMHIRSKGS